MKPPQNSDALSRRERQIMDIVFERAEATAAEVRDALPDPPSYSAVRTLLRILEDKGHLRHRAEGVRYVYLPTQNANSAARGTLNRVVQTFFGGSVEKAVATLLSEKETRLTDAEYDRLSALIEQAHASNSESNDERNGDDE